MKEQIPEPVKTERSAELLKLEKEQSDSFRRKYIGQKAQVLLEEEKKYKGTRWLLGHTADYVRVAVPAEEGLGLNTLVDVKVSGFLEEDVLQGTTLP